ncbi:hypothetical protein P1X15_29560 [Runella sp. MFBS21]|uniref:DUF3846 domain-containing protein n=1 Tax=Runella sp. MFBS21 TaxID=3034018 RepID=UPI0023F9273B|nr:hypothetical protein [Runella sp. MFBS21]MDF7821801.1 hypothetical protein [Runella sp. MFBS21]
MNTSVKTVDVYLINPIEKTITMVALPKKNKLDEIYKVLDCQLIDFVNVGENDLVIDDEGLYVENQTYFTWIDLIKDEEENYQVLMKQIAGKTLFVGIDQEGSITTPTIPIEELKYFHVRFI